VGLHVTIVSKQEVALIAVEQVRRLFALRYKGTYFVLPVSESFNGAVSI
jgi:hypothetical protein